MWQRTPFSYRVLITLLGLALLVGCFGDDDDAGPTGIDLLPATPLTANYWPLDEGTTWTYLRVERGVYSPDPNINYFNPALPSAHRSLEVLSAEGSVNGLTGRRLRNLLSSEAEGGGQVWVDNEIFFDDSGGGIELLGENPVDSISDNANFIFNDVILAAGQGYSWIAWNRLHWESPLANYAADSMPEYIFIVPPEGEELPIDMGELRYGRTLLQWALGFDYQRAIYPLGGQTDITSLGLDEYSSDVDHDLYADGIGAVRLTGDVIADTEFRYADLGATADSLFPELKDVVYPDCKLVRFSLEIDLLRSNHRFANAGPSGQVMIDYPFKESNVILEVARRDIGLMLFARDVGPVMISTDIDLDKMIKSGNPEEPMTLYQPDLMKIDYLVSRTVPPTN
jgi:hypothetical protein